MATTDTIFTLSPQGAVVTETLYATFDTIIDAAAAGPKSITPVLVFDDAAAWYAEWAVEVPSHYDGGGFTWSYKGGGTGTSATAINMDLSARVIATATGLGTDLDLDGATVSSIDLAQSTTANALTYSTTQTLTHANAGSPSVGDYMIWRLTRDIGDTSTDNMNIAKVLILET